MNLVELKAKIYDLMAARQKIEIEMQQINVMIAEELKPKEEPKAK